MKAIIYESPGHYALVEKEKPRLADPGDLLIRIEAASICGSDVHILADPPGICAVPGTTIGHELVGRVEEVGEAVRSFSAGDRVVLDNNVPCGECVSCRTGHPNMCQNMRTIGVDADGAFAEYLLAPARMAVRISDDLPADVAIFAEPLNCVFGAVDKVRILPGQSVLIMGAGPIGLYFLKLMKLSGSGLVIVSEVSPYRKEFAKRCGADLIVDPTKEELAASVMEATGGLGVDLAIDAVGTLIAPCIDCTRANGEVLLFGNNASVTETITQADITKKELTIRGSYVGPHTLPATVALLESGRLDLSELITHRIRLDEFETGIEAMRKGEAIEVIITP